MMTPLRQTHTFAELEVSPATYDEVCGKLEDAGYTHALQDGVIDMHGIGLAVATANADDGIARRYVRERVFRAGYVVRNELWVVTGEPDRETPMRCAYTPSGDYIGAPKTAALLARRGIRPQMRTGTSRVCSIGYCEREKKWYGWSHRAIFGFGIGHRVKSGHMPEQYVGSIVRTLADAKMFAEAFAAEVI